MQRSNGIVFLSLSNTLLSFVDLSHVLCSGITSVLSKQRRHGQRRKIRSTKMKAMTLQERVFLRRLLTVLTKAVGDNNSLDDVIDHGSALLILHICIYL